MKYVGKILTTGVFAFALSAFMAPVASYATNNDNSMIKKNNPPSTSKCAKCWGGFKSCAKNTYIYLESDDFRNKLHDVGIALTLMNSKGLLPSTVPLDKIQTVLSLASTASDTFDKMSKEDTVAGKLEEILKNSKMLSPALEELFPSATPLLNKIDLNDKTQAILEIIGVFKQVDKKDSVLNWDEALKQLQKVSNTPKNNVDKEDHMAVASLKSLQNHVPTIGKLLDPTNEMVDFKTQN